MKHRPKATPCCSIVIEFPIPPLPAIHRREIPMSEERKYAILFAATLLCARKLAALDSDRPSPTKIAAVQDAISQATFILEQIDRKWPTESFTS